MNRDYDVDTMHASSASHSRLVSHARSVRLITRRCLRTPTRYRFLCPPVPTIRTVFEKTFELKAGAF
jgi:hypothetical protein